MACRLRFICPLSFRSHRILRLVENTETNMFNRKKKPVYINIWELYREPDTQKRLAKRAIHHLGTLTKRGIKGKRGVFFARNFTVRKVIGLVPSSSANPSSSPRSAVMTILPLRRPVPWGSRARAATARP
mmetsp:Transcript_39367/g.76866  ORF Transcript_39367/g.76866 Transcript_39367/m.76866 type:complete len:130 (-) Transcript_39367:556-945(-)